MVQKLFSDEWEIGTFEAMKTITETYADYFRDLHGWLSEYFFAKLARACFEKSVKVTGVGAVMFFLLALVRCCEVL